MCIDLCYYDRSQNTELSHHPQVPLLLSLTLCLPQPWALATPALFFYHFGFVSFENFIYMESRRT